MDTRYHSDVMISEIVIKGITTVLVTLIVCIASVNMLQILSPEYRKIKDRYESFKYCIIAFAQKEEVEQLKICLDKATTFYPQEDYNE